MTLCEAYRRSERTGCTFWRLDNSEPYRVDPDYGELRRLDDGCWIFCSTVHPVFTVDDIASDDWQTAPYVEAGP